MHKTILMIHGMWGNRSHWDRYRPFFEHRGYRCLAPDLPYHDTDPTAPPPRQLGTSGLMDYVRDLENRIIQLDHRPIIMGHSMGGLLAQILAARGRAKALVLLAPAAPRGINAITLSTVRCFWGVLTTWGFWRKAHHVSYDAISRAVYNRVPEMQRRDLYERLVYESGRAMVQIGLAAFDPNGATTVEASAVRCPLLLIAGARDRMTPASVCRRIYRKYLPCAHPATAYREFGDHAHWLLGEPGWERIAETIHRWLERTS